MLYLFYHVFSVLHLPFVVLSYLLVLIHHLFSFVIVCHLHYLLSKLRVLVAFLPQLLKLMLQNSELFIVLDDNINICVARFPILYVLTDQGYHVWSKEFVQVKFHMLKFCDWVYGLYVFVADLVFCSKSPLNACSHFLSRKLYRVITIATLSFYKIHILKWQT